MRRHTLIVAFAAVLLLAVGQPASSQPHTRFVLACVMDPAGTPMTGLIEDDFVVREAGERREILGVAPAHYPIAVLVDTSSFARPVFIQLRNALVRFLGALSGREAALYTFGDVALRVLDFTSAVGVLQQKAGGLFAEPQGQTHAADAIIRSATDLKKRGSAIGMILVLSAGGIDRSSRMPAVVEQAVVGSRAVVNVIDMRMATISAPANRPGSLAPAVDNSMVSFAAERLLRDLTERTLGRYDRIFSGSGFDEALNALRRQVEAEVVVEYAVPAGSVARSLEVGTKVPGATVRGVGLDRTPR
jgi:hypothetical protein